MARTIAEMSIDTRLILERLDRAAIGETVSYDELSQLIGRDVRAAYHLTLTARRRLLVTAKKYFEPVRGVAFRRCTDAEKVAGGGTYLTRSRRACRKGARITTSVDDYDAMSKEDKVRHNAQLSLLMTMQAISTPARLKAIKSRVELTQQSLSMVKTLEAIAGVRVPTAQKRVGGQAGHRLRIDVK